MKKQFGDYYLGLDLGTNSVGWAITDMNYNILKLNGKSLWGIRLFEEAKTGADMRINRAGRRRIERASWRVKLLQELFAEEICKLDPAFYLRIKESNLQEKDKSQGNRVKYSIFGSKFLSDQQYYALYPTIYHLREAMLENKPEAFDVRLLYLVLSHMFKHRGHFLFEGLNAENVNDFAAVYDELVHTLNENVEGFEEWKGGDKSVVMQTVSNRMLNVSEKKKYLLKFMDAYNSQIKELAIFLSGGKGKFSNLFADENLKQMEKDSYSLKDGNFTDDEPELEKELAEKFGIIEKIKGIYDWGLLQEILHGKKNLSSGKVSVYEEHQKDLELLKNFIREKAKHLYKSIFSYKKGDKENYSCYVGQCFLPNGKAAVIEANTCNQDTFCKFLTKTLKGIKEFEEVTGVDANVSELQALFYRIKLGTAFPKQVSKSNGVIPVQVNKAELEQILENAKNYLPFLNNEDEKGISVAEKLVDILCFRIPYYVGPLAGTSMTREKKRCWSVRKAEGKVTPWNFEEVVDVSASAERFITNMTNKCSYLEGEDVLPKASLLYSEFVTRNELNNLTVNGEKLSVEIINGIIENLILNGKGKLTKKKIADYLRFNNICPKAYKDDIAGVDDTLQASMQPYKDFYNILGKTYVDRNRDVVENIIKWITIFSEEKSMLVEKIKKNYPEITYSQIGLIRRLRYKDWGRLSATLLDSSDISFVDDSTGEFITIIEAMRRNALNLMQLLSNNCHYDFIGKIKEYNDRTKETPDEITIDFVDKMYVSPAIKRTIWQTLLIVKELKKILGHDPKRIFMEMPRGEGEKVRTVSRKKKLEELYKNAKDMEPELKESLLKQLERYSDEDLRKNKLYFYFSQMGRCMYTGRKIDLEELMAKENGVDLYDRDHIYPRSKTKDDSLDNLVLVYYKENREKTDVYPLKPEIQDKMTGFWRVLLRHGLISQSKFNKLTRKTMLTNEELASFVNRQLVETSQSTKAVAELLQLECPSSKMVYSKAGNVSDFRHEFDMLKCRDINDLHHAKDAYLNIVVGNVYHTKFTDNPYNYISRMKKEERYSLKTREMYARNVERGNVVAWIAGDNGTMSTVRHTMNKNNILFTRMAVENKGKLYDISMCKKGVGQIPLKKNRDIESYGGYNSADSAYFMLVKSDTKKGNKVKQQITIETVPVIKVKEITSSEDNIIKFLKDDCQLENPSLLIPKMLKFSLLEVNGCRIHITGKSTVNITSILASQLILGYKWEKYMKRICGFVHRKEENKNAVIKSIDGINREENLELYDILLEKHVSKIYSNRPSKQIETLKAGRKQFIELTLEEQCDVLFKIGSLFWNKSVTANLTAIGGKATVGLMNFNKNVTDKNLLVIDQSVTGVFENKKSYTL